MRKDKSVVGLTDDPAATDGSNDCLTMAIGCFCVETLFQLLDPAFFETERSGCM